MGQAPGVMRTKSLGSFVLLNDDAVGTSNGTGSGASPKGASAYSALKDRGNVSGHVPA